MSRSVFTLLEYEEDTNFAQINRVRAAVSSTLICSAELCGEILDWSPRAARRIRRIHSSPEVIPQAEEDVRRAVEQAEAALDAREGAPQDAEQAAAEKPEGERA